MKFDNINWDRVFLIIVVGLLFSALYISVLVVAIILSRRVSVEVGLLFFVSYMAAVVWKWPSLMRWCKP